LRLRIIRETTELLFTKTVDPTIIIAITTERIKLRVAARGCFTAFKVLNLLTALWLRIVRDTDVAKTIDIHAFRLWSVKAQLTVLIYMATWGRLTALNIINLLTASRLGIFWDAGAPSLTKTILFKLLTVTQPSLLPHPITTGVLLTDLRVLMSYTEGLLHRDTDQIYPTLHLLRHRLSRTILFRRLSRSLTSLTDLCFFNPAAGVLHTVLRIKAFTALWRIGDTAKLYGASTIAVRFIRGITAAATTVQLAELNATTRGCFTGSLIQVFTALLLMLYAATTIPITVRPCITAVLRQLFALHHRDMTALRPPLTASGLTARWIRLITARGGLLLMAAICPPEAAGGDASI